MKSMQRQAQKLTNKGGGDDAKVSVLLQDFEEADKMLAKIINASNTWREAWVSILTNQLSIVTSVEELYNPIIGASSDGHGHGYEPVLTPQAQLDRSYKLKQAYTELKTELLEEVNMMDERIIKPATDAKEYIQPIKKTIKKRENKRLDYERHFDRVTNATKKQRRSEREEAALAKAEIELSKATDVRHEEFKFADAHLRDTLPPIVEATFAILPHLLAAQIMIQNALLAQYYTTLHNYCEEEGFSSPPPPMADVIAQWNTDFKPIQQDIESINCIARGKAVHSLMQLGDDPANRRNSSVTGLNIRHNASTSIQSRRGPSPGMITSSNSLAGKAETRVMRIPSSNSISTVGSPRYEDSEPEPEPQRDQHLSPVYSPQVGYSPAGPTRDYFARDRQASGGSISPGAAMAAGKKKPPPPPPPKRINSGKPDIWVTAVYGFEGQEAGDLSFREGDRIKVTKKTESMDDWWDGEVRGHKGRFPANYCEIAN